MSVCVDRAGTGEDAVRLGRPPQALDLALVTGPADLNVSALRRVATTDGRRWFYCQGLRLAPPSGRQIAPKSTQNGHIREIVTRFFAATYARQGNVSAPGGSTHSPVGRGGFRPRPIALRIADCGLRISRPGGLGRKAAGRWGRRRGDRPQESSYTHGKMGTVSPQPRPGPRRGRG